MDKKKIIATILLLLGIYLSIFCLSSCTSTFIGRTIWWNVGDMEDYRKFPSRHLNASASPLKLPEQTQTDLFDSLSMNKGAVVFNSGELHQLLAEQETRSLIIIKDGVNIFERYYHGYKRDTINRSFSISKSLTSMLIGVAIKEGKIKSVNDWFHDYVPEYKDTPNFQPMNIHHLLNMTTGIDYSSGYMPWNDGVRGEQGQVFHYHILSVISYTAKMARPLRLEYPNALYHVTSRGDGQEDIYEGDSDRETFLDILSHVCDRMHWKVYVYCLMTNHYHLVVQTPEANLSKGMRQLNGVYTQAFNRYHGRVGHVFQGRYKAIHVDKDAYLLELSRYVVLNPQINAL